MIEALRSHVGMALVQGEACDALADAIKGSEQGKNAVRQAGGAAAIVDALVACKGDAEMQRAGARLGSVRGTSVATVGREQPRAAQVWARVAERG